MHKPFAVFGIGLACALIATPFASAQTKAKLKTKPPVTAPVKTDKQPIVLGTKQMVGDFGAFGQAYTIGKNSPLNVTLNRAEYSAARFCAAENTFAPTTEQKLLILHMTVHNPQSSEQRFDANSLAVTGVDKKDVNHEYVGWFTREGTTEPLDVVLKPAQKLEIQTAILVPANGVVPKLIVKREPDAPVIRYDLREKVQALPAPFADPADPTGATFRKAVPAQIGTFYPSGYFDTRIDSVTYTTESINSEEPEEGKRFLVISATLRHATGEAATALNGGRFAATTRLADADTVPHNGNLVKGAKNELLDITTKAGMEVKVRFYCLVPKDTAVKTWTFAENLDGTSSHDYVFDISGAK